MMKKFLCSGALLGMLLVLAGGAQADGQQLNEGFDGAGLPAGWTMANFSTNPASEAWFRPLNSADTFTAQNGASDSYIASSVFVGATDADGNPTGSIDAMLATPVVSMSDATVLSFWTRSVTGNSFGETLRIGAIVAGSFTDLMTINPSAIVGVYPESWTAFSITLPAQGEGVTGRFFFEYVVSDAETAGNFIGLDSVSVSAVPESGSGLLMLAGGLSLLAWQRRRVSSV